MVNAVDEILEIRVAGFDGEGLTLPLLLPVQGFCPIFLKRT